MGITRRTFIGAFGAAVMAAKTGLPSGQLYSASGATVFSEKVDHALSNGEIHVTRLGHVLIRDDNEIYKVLRFHLRKMAPSGDMLEAYCDIDTKLLDVCPNKKAFIYAELGAIAESMVAAEEQYMAGYPI